MSKKGTIILAILYGIFSIFIIPTLSFWLAYFGGWVCKIMFGTPLIAGLNYIFRQEASVDMIPIFSGTVAFIVCFVKDLIKIKMDTKVYC